MPPTTVYFDAFCLELSTDLLWRGPERCKLTAKAFAVLRYLALHPERLVSKAELFEAVWPGVVVSDWALSACVREIRRVLGEAAQQPRILETVHGRGYRFLSAVTTHPGPLADTPHAVRSPRQAVFVGRETELGRLHAWLDMALHGARQCVFVTGEPGIGKTALVEAFLAGCEPGETGDGQPHPCIGWGQCLELYGAGEAYMPVLEALGRVGRSPAGAALKGVLHTYAPTWLIQLSALVSPEECTALQPRVLGVMQERMLRELAEALEVLTLDQPLILVLEDLHWADASTLALVSVLARRPEPARLLVLGTYRPSEARREGARLQLLAQELAVHGYCHELAVPCFDETAITAYLEARFPQSLLPTRLARALHDRSGGNPLFVVHIVQDLVARGVIAPTAGTWTMHGDLDVLTPVTPAGLRHLVALQRARLQPTTQRVLEAASVAGLEFSAAEVAAALDLGVADVEEHCAQLAEDHQFVHAAGVSAWPDHTLAARYRFVHALYQELWHERVSTSRLQEWHRRIGERKEAAYGSHAGEIAAELAVHFAQGRDLPRALRYLQQAGEQALQRNAYAESIHHLRQALAYLNALPEGLQRAQHELQLQATLGVPLLCTRGYAASEVERAYSRAYQLCQQVGETPRLFPIVFGLFRFYLVRGDVPTARTLGEQLLRLAQQGPTPLLLPAAYAAAGGSLFHLGEIASARALVEQGHALYEQPQQEALVPVHGDDAGVVCLSFAAWALWLLGYPDQALAKSYAAFTLAQTSPYTFVRATNCVALAYCLAWSRELQALQACAETALAYSVEQGFPHFIGNFTIFQGWACAMQGNPAVGLAHIRQGLALYHTMGTGLYTPYFLSLLAEAYGKAGQVKAGLAALAKAFALMHTTEERWCEPELYRLQGELTLQQAGLRGHASRLWTRPTATIPPTQAHTASTDAEAEACFLKAIDIARRQQARSWELRATVSLARLWQRQGKDHAARTMLSDLYAWFTEGWETADLQEAQALLDALSHHR